MVPEKAGEMGTGACVWEFVLEEPLLYGKKGRSGKEMQAGCKVWYKTYRLLFNFEVGQQDHLLSRT